jgi:hypothetical protein
MISSIGAVIAFSHSGVQWAWDQADAFAGGATYVGGRLEPEGGGA